MYMFEWMYAASTFGRVFVLLFYNTMWPVPVVVVFVFIVADVTGAGCSVMVCSVVRRCYCFFPTVVHFYCMALVEQKINVISIRLKIK